MRTQSAPTLSTPQSWEQPGTCNAQKCRLGPKQMSVPVFTGPEVIQINALQVFDRWGDKLFEQFDLAPNVASAWDGTYRGKLVTPGVYVWYAEIRLTDGTVLQKNGDVMVIR